jgi:hypothetical protein
MDKAHIDWNYSGKPDLTVGTGAVTQEQILAYASGLILPLLYLYWYLTGHLDWTPWQYALAAILALDIGAGAVANALNSCKRFYHTPRKVDETATVGLLKNKYFFTALHVYPMLAGFLFGSTNWLYGVGWYALLLLGAFAVHRTPLYLQRPAAVLVVLLVILMNNYLIPPIEGFEWLMPLLFIKIVLGHIVREEPYRPLPIRKP